MSDQTDNLLVLLEPFGLSQEEAMIYLDLLENKISTALSISRRLHLGRTKVYRLLDKLIEKQLVTQQFDTSGFKFVANDPSQFDILLSREEGRLQAIRKTLPQVINTLEKKVGQGKPGSSIHYYRGKEGLSQVNWNLLNANGELLSYEVATADVYMPQREAERLRKSLVENKIMIKTLTNKKALPAFTEVTELVKSWWQIRYVPLQTLSIRADVFIYNNVYAVCHYLDNKDIFCFEMYNEELAQMQKELFENMWKEAKPLKIINDHGQASL